MESNQGNLDIFDLLSERHSRVHKTIENRWNEQSDIQLSNSEWLILDRLYQQREQTIADVCRNVDITRQATHKLIKKLEDRDLVVTSQMKNNKRSKLVSLTNLGVDSYENKKALKIKLEKQIKDEIGEMELTQLKVFLASDWGL